MQRKILTVVEIPVEIPILVVEILRVVEIPILEERPSEYTRSQN